MKKIAILSIITLFYMAGIFVVACADSSDKKQPKETADTTKITVETSKPLPKLIDLGSKTCIPCKKMAPILDSLREEYKARGEVIFTDTKENRKAAAEFKIAFIPTQVFIDTTGKEVFRHVGFYPADSIVMQFKAMGVK